MGAPLPYTAAGSTLRARRLGEGAPKSEGPFPAREALSVVTSVIRSAAQHHGGGNDGYRDDATVIVLLRRTI